MMRAVASHREELLAGTLSTVSILASGALNSALSIDKSSLSFHAEFGGAGLTQAVRSASQAKLTGANYSAGAEETAFMPDQIPSRPFCG